MCWQSKHYGNKGMLWGEITPKNHVICVKSAHNLFHFTMPFDANSNAVVSAKTCEYHYGKHHATYVANLNNLIKDTKFANASFYEILTNSEGGLYNNVAQVYNHDFYWDCIAKKSEMSSELKAAIEANFVNFKEEF